MFNCKDCTKRYPGCQDHCESYQSAKAENERIKAARKLETEYRNYIVGGRATRLSDEAARRKRQSGYKKFGGRH
jgi:hypothetical protein